MTTGYPAPPLPPKRGRRAVVIAAVVAAFAILLCGGGGTATYLLLRESETAEGAAEPVVAVDAFMKAMYQDQDARAAYALVCTESRDIVTIEQKLSEIKTWEQTHQSPKFRWEKPTVAEQVEDRAVVSVTLSALTADDRSMEQQLTFTVIRKTGWWVCEVG